MLEIQLGLISIFFSVILCVNSLINNNIKEFIINKHLKLKLENSRTNIYVNNRPFRQCMYLLLNVDLQRVEDYDEIESIDEAAEKLDRSMERHPQVRNKITPEEEFIGHCSNIQAWVDNGYDTRILHRNLAFPLLKRLAEVGDPEARRVFKEEIAIRYASHHPSVVTFLTQNGYLKYLNAEEFESLLQDQKIPILEGFAHDLKLELERLQYIALEPHVLYPINNILKNFGIQHVPLIISCIIKEIPEKFREKFIKLVYNMFKSNPKFPLIQFLNNFLEYFKDLNMNFVKYKETIVGIFHQNKLLLAHKNIQDIKSLDFEKDKHKEVEELDLSDNQIKDMEGLETFSNLKVLKLNNNQITQIRGLEKLDKLENLTLRNNKISEIKGFEKLPNIKLIDLSGNSEINEIPESINQLSTLGILKLWDCNIRNYIESTSKFFWTNQNYRYYSGYTQKDREYYEKTHTNKALSDNKLYKHFVEWVIKMRYIMKEQNFNYADIEKFEKESLKNAVWSGQPTIRFKKWLKNKSQKRITSYF